MLGLFDPVYLMIVGPTILIALWAQFKVKGAYGKWSKIGAASRITGAQAAKMMLERAGIGDVRIEQGRGMLSDHYDPRVRMLRLSPLNFSGTSVAAVGVACHEAGHAIQHAKGYAPLALRNTLVPVASIGSYLAWPLIFIGMIMQWAGLATAGLIAFGALVAFQLITLPVEFDASRRAKEQIRSLGIVQSREEGKGVSAVLDAAAMTYVAATVTALAQLLYFALRLGLLGGRDD
jgi:Zn-dependent membrane protease YugP